MPQDTGATAGPEQLFELTTFLAGPTRAWGVFEDRFGKLRRRFEVTMNGRWEGAVFILDEDFTYDTGETDQRTWRVEALGGGRFRASCPDCVGEASGCCDRDSIRMGYRFRLKIGTRTTVVTFDDRIYRMSATRAVNRATMSKWGLKLGELSLFFHRSGEGSPGDDTRAAS